MCGIVGYIGSKNCTDVLIAGLSKLEYRGYDSAGVSFFENNSIRTIKSKGRLKLLEEKLISSNLSPSNCGIGHTRWATHGEPSDINSHPHGSGVVSIVHNGIIENYLDIKKHLIKKGYQFESETDTETVSKLLEDKYSGDPISAIKETVEEIRGSYAFGIVFGDFPDTIYAIRKESPLIVGLSEGENFIASDIPAILKYTKDYHLLEENEIAIVKKDSVKIIDLYQNEIKKERLTANFDIEAAEKGGYPHFMLKEINEQPKALRDTINPRIGENGLPNFGIENLTIENLKKYNKIHIVGCGTAMHAGMVGKALIEKLARIQVDVDIASEFRYRDPIINKEDLVIIISQSGETADTLAALKLAKRHGCHVIGIVNVVGSSIARESNSVIYTWAGPEISVASTKAYSVQLSVLYMLAINLAFARGSITEEEAISLFSTLCEIPSLVEKCLLNDEEIKQYASLFINCKDLFFLGRGLDYSASLEGSLKLKEISYIHSEAYAAGELKHGTISLITDNIPVLAVATQQKLLEKMVSNIKETKARGAKVLIFCKESTSDLSDCSDYRVNIPDCPDLFTPLLSAVPLQLFAYYSSVIRGCDVDKPRNLAKSVTVE